MQRPKSDLSLTVSSQISKYILNRARQAYLHRIHTESINERSLQASKQFPVECTQKVMELFSFQPSQNPKKIVEECQQSPPQSCRDYHRPVRTVNITPRLSLKPFEERGNTFRPKSTIKKTVEMLQTLQQSRKCEPLVKQQDEDQQIQLMREKKQRVFELQRYFIQSQKQEKSKLKHKQSQIISNGNITTDFNGQRIEMRGIHGKREPQPFLMVQMGLSIREEKEQNRFHIVQEQPSLKKKTYRKESSLQQTKYDIKSKSKLSKESVNFQAFTLKEIENFINKDKRRKNQTINRISKHKIAQLIPINLTKII